MLRVVPTSRSTICIRAPREAVWRVVTEPAYVKQWQYGSTLETDWGMGSPIRFSAEWKGQRLEQWGTVLGVERPVRLSYSLFAPRPGYEDRPEHSFTMSYELTEDADGTLLTFVQEDPRSTDDTAGQDPATEQDDTILRALKELAESIARSATG